MTKEVLETLSKLKECGRLKGDSAVGRVEP